MAHLEDFLAGQQPFSMLTRGSRLAGARARAGLPLGDTEEDRLNALLGLEEPELEEMPAAGPGFRPTGFQSFLEGLSGLEQTGLGVRPTTFGEGLLEGLARGLGGAGTRVAAERERLEKSSEERRKAIERANLEATKEFRAERGRALSRLTQEQREQIRKQSEFERDNPIVSPELAARVPELAGFLGERLSRASIERLMLQKPDPSLARIEAEAEARARGARRGAPPTGPTSPLLAGKLPTATERDKLVGDLAVIDQTATIRNLFKPEFVGPIAGRRGAVSMVTEVGLKPGEEDFRGALALYRNAVINALSGAAVSAQEAIRLRQQIPQETDPPRVFLAKLRQTENNVRQAAQVRRNIFTQTGIDLSGIPPLPSGADESPDGMTDEEAYQQYLQIVGDR